MAGSLKIQHDRNRSGKFHWLFLGDGRSHRRCDRIVLETEHFIVMPSLGSIVAGWLLMVPKLPINRIADLNVRVRGEFEALVQQCIRLVEAQFGNAYIFEHGGRAGSVISCGVDQAHLHIAPLPFDLLDAAYESTRQPWKVRESLILPYDFVSEDEYWYVSNQTHSIVTEVIKPQSQWFRKLIAEQTGETDHWNYNEYPFHDHIEQTLKVMGVDD